MHDAQLRRHHTATRAVVLDILAAQDELDRGRILDAWLAAQPGMGGAHLQQLPRMLDEIL